MTAHLFGAIVTPHGVAANNHGDSPGGNLLTLQKVLWNGDVHSTVSAEAIRWAMRADWQRRNIPVNRHWDEDNRRHRWNDGDFLKAGRPFIDDDVLGYMHPRAAAQEASEDSEGEPTRRQRRGRAPRANLTLVRRSRFEATRAISLSPWTGDVVFSAASVGASRVAGGDNPAPYSGEVHATRYQYAFALTPEHLLDRARAAAVVDAIVDLAEVAGSHARFFYDFAPDTIIFRWTDDPAPRILYPFYLDEQQRLTVPELLRRVRAGDVSPTELIVGGSLAELPDGVELKGLGAFVHAGVKAAAQEAKNRLAQVNGG